MDVVRWLLLLSLLVGCAKTSESVSYAPSTGAVSYGEDEADYRPSPKPMSPGRADMDKDAGPPPAEPAPDQTAISEPPPVQAAARMVHYSGYAQLRVTRPAETLDAIVALAVASGGRVENLYASAVTVRVPVARFDEVWQQVRKMGDLLDESVTAEDVTESFLAVDLRVRTLTATRDRLVTLLAKSEDEQEKLALIREIQRVTEELDQLETQLRTLQGLADLSRISVSVVPREAFTSSRTAADELAGFRWIRALSPFRRDVGSEGKRLALETGDALVVLDPKGSFVAESADGAVVWTGRLANDPVGDATFWATAVRERLAPDFAEATVRAVGDWQCVRFVDASETSYRWNVCVAVEGKQLWLAQSYYPTPAQEERYGAVIDGALTAIGADGVAGGAE